jgi:histidinol dehydrogenase
MSVSLRVMRVIRLGGSDDDDRAARALARRSVHPEPAVDAAVRDILATVRERGDDAVREYTERFDGRAPEPDRGGYEIPRARWDEALARIAPQTRAALELAAERIRAFHAHQRDDDVVVEDSGDGDGGVWLAQRVAPLARVGIYVPGGTARYPSSVLMTAIPARVAGVGEIVMVTPGASDETLAAAALAGVHRAFEIGGAQAVAALAYGTARVPRVDKIVGPGNQWVAAAKRQVFGEVDIDSVAGPSEVLIVADDTARPRWIAADLLAQAEHDTEARPILVTTHAPLVAAVDAALAEQLGSLPRAAIARESLSRYGVAVIARDRDAAVAFANDYAPEHLELHVAEPRALAAAIRTAGAVFIGPYTPEAAGDYVAGPNHVLPTGGAARYASPLSVHDFRKRTSYIEYSRGALVAQAAAITALAAVEGLDAHGRSVSIRLADEPGSDS